MVTLTDKQVMIPLTKYKVDWKGIQSFEIGLDFQAPAKSRTGEIFSYWALVALLCFC